MPNDPLKNKDQDNLAVVPLDTFLDLVTEAAE
jgi:hypothetical protein